jgi:hypothetical protein
MFLTLTWKMLYLRGYMVGGFSSILFVVAVLELNVVYLLEFFCRKIVKQELRTVKRK